MRIPKRRLDWSIRIGSLLVSWAMAVAHPGLARGDEEVRWYTPKIEDFRLEYDRDARNQKSQTWREYSGWINEFYAGNAFSSGWTKQAKASVAPVKSAKRKQELMKLLNDLGKDISKEWAKDNAIRKISTNDLNRWNGLIQAARRTDRGTGDQLKETLEFIQGEVAKKLK